MPRGKVKPCEAENASWTFKLGIHAGTAAGGVHASMWPCYATQLLVTVHICVIAIRIGQNRAAVDT